MVNIINFVVLYFPRDVGNLRKWRTSFKNTGCIYIKLPHIIPLFRGGIRRFVTPRDAENNKAIMRAENTYYSISNTVAVYPHSLVK